MTIQVAPARVVAICDRMLTALAELKPQMDAFCDAEERAYKEEADRRMRDIEAEQRKAKQEWDAYQEAHKRWKRSIIKSALVEPKMPAYSRGLAYPDWGVPPLYFRVEFDSIRREVNNMRILGLFAVAPIPLGNDDVRSLHEWDAGIVIERIRKQVASVFEICGMPVKGALHKRSECLESGQ